MTILIRDRETGRDVDLEGLIPEEMLFCLYVASVHPDRYDGADAKRCLRGWANRVNQQTYRYLLECSSALNIVDFAIYHRVTEQNDPTNATEALGMASTALGVDMQATIDTYAARAGYYPRLARKEEADSHA